MSRRRPRFIALTGGVGGAKLCLGLASILAADEVTFVVNTADDFAHLGLHVSPDIDTLMYTLGGLSNREMGWGRAGETWRFMEALQVLGGETWFRLGDADLATHVRRTELLHGGLGLSEVTAMLSAALGISHTILPMSDDPVRTRVHTAQGTLAFQHYFVRDRCEPGVTRFEFAGSADARVNPAIETAFRDPALAGVFICPSNPYVSVDPILSLPGFVSAMRAPRVPVIAVSPIIGGEAVKGPTAKMMRELSVPANAVAVAAHYRNTIDGFILDQRDAAAAAEIAQLGIETTVAQTLMVSLADRTNLARTAIEFASRLNRGN